MKLPETLLLAVGCAALAGCGTSEAGGLAAPADPPPAAQTTIPEAVPAPPADSLIPEVGQHDQGAVPVRQELPKTGRHGGGTDPADIGIGIWSGDDCPGCGMG